MEFGVSEAGAVGKGSASPRLGDLLVERGLVSRAQLAEALLQQSVSGKRIGTLLVELGLLDERALASVLAAQAEVPVVDLRDVEPDPDAVGHLPETIARAATAIPVRIIDGVLEVAVADPTNHDAVGLLSGEAAMPVRVVVAPASDIRRMIASSYRALTGVESYIQAFQEAEERRRGRATHFEDATEDAPVVQVVNLVITQAMRDRSSDIHIEPQEGRVRLRFRIDGALHDVLALPVEMGPALVSRIKILAGMNIVERRRPQDGQFSIDIDGHTVDVRVSTTATLWGEKCVLRLLDKSRSLLSLEDVGIKGLAAGGTGVGSTYEDIIKSPFGMVIVVGPTGSGKTTTLYATLGAINAPERNITTVEDPVEYVFPSINQIQINESAGLSFADGLKSILRQDPDVILVGEMRDVETARLAVQSALTGHFVLSTLHATDAAAAVQRLLDMGIEPFLVASSLLGIVSQRLVRRICPHCRERYTPPADELAFYEQSGGPTKEPWTFERGRGCTFCSRTGFLDRVGVFEMIRVSDAIKRLIVERASHDEIREAAVANGMKPMRRQAMQLVADGVTTIGEVIRSIYLL